MEYIYIKSEHNQGHIDRFKKRLEAMTLEKLVQAYNKEAKCGIVGVHMQALYLIALRQKFKERLTESPVYLLEHILGLVGPIEVEDGHVKLVK